MKVFWVFCSILCFSMGGSDSIGRISINETSIFIANLISQRFSHCSLLFLRDGFDNSETLNEVVSKTGLNYYNIKYRNSTEIKAPVKLRMTVSMYPKWVDPCKVVLLLLTDTRPELIQSINDLLTPVYLPIVRKDADFFIFVTEPGLMDTILTIPQLPAKIKFKISVGIEPGNRELVVKSVCLFCGDGGTPEIIKYPNSGIVDYYPDFVLNLNGKVLRISCPGIVSRIDTYGRPWTELRNAKRGLWKNLFEDFLMLKFNFTYNMFLSMGKDDKVGRGGTGFELPNGTWIGVVGDIVAGNADFGVVTAHTAKRIRHVDFTNSFFDISFLSLITSEAPRIYSPSALLWPFDLLMWICIALSTLAVFIIFTLFPLVPTTQAPRPGAKYEDKWGPRRQIFFVITTYLDQDSEMPRGQPLRFFVAFWLFFTLILTTVYRSKLVSILAFPPTEKLPETFEELVNSDYEVGFMKQGDAAYNTLKASTDAVYVKLVSEMDVITGLGLECLERAISRKYGCIGYEGSLTFLKARNLSDADLRKLVTAPATTFNIFMSLATEGGSMYKRNFDKWIRQTRAFHLPDIWIEKDMLYNMRLPKRDWWIRTNQTEKLVKTKGEESSNLTFKNISGAFYIGAFGLLLAFLLFIQELLRFYQRKLIHGRMCLCWQTIRDKMGYVSTIPYDRVQLGRVPSQN